MVEQQIGLSITSGGASFTYTFSVPIAVSVNNKSRSPMIQTEHRTGLLGPTSVQLTHSKRIARVAGPPIKVSHSICDRGSLIPLFWLQGDFTEAS
jgi:hypothetical protein